MQVDDHEEPGQSSCRVAEPEAERMRSEVSRGPNARAGAQLAPERQCHKRELQAEAEQLRLEVLRLKSSINGEVGVDDWQVLRKSAVGVVDWQLWTKSARDDYTLPKQDPHVGTMDDCKFSQECSLDGAAWV